MTQDQASEQREDAPTLSGYREYAAAMSGKDSVAKQCLDERQQQQPAVGQYAELYAKEQRLRDHSRGETYLSRMRSFVADVRDKELPCLNDARDRRAVVWHIKSEYEQWGHERKELHARQRAAFERNIELALQKRQEQADTQESPDAAAFFARQEVIRRYVQQHEQLNARVQHDISGYIDQAVERQTDRNRQSMSRSESVILDEIVRQPRESTLSRRLDGGAEREL